MIVPLLIAAGVLGIAAELLCRWYMKHRARPCVWQPHTKLHMKMSREVLPELEELVRSEANAEGERGDDIPPGKKTFRALVIGGSAAECFYLDKDSGWPGVARAIMSRPENLERLGAEHVHMGNIARAGVGSVALKKMLDLVLPSYDDLDLILCMVGASDVLRWFARGAEADDNEPEIRTSEYMAFVPDRPYGWHPKRTALAALARRILKSRRREPEVREDTGQRVGQLRKMRQEAATLRTETGDPSRMLDRFEATFRQVLDQCRARATRVIVVRQPWFEKDHTDHEESFFWNAAQGDPFKETCDTYFHSTMMRQRMKDMDNRAVDVCDEMNIEHIDLLPHLDMSRATFYDFFHYTPLGARKLGEVVAEKILGVSDQSPT